MMKKVIALLLTMVLALSLTTACVSQSATPADSSGGAASAPDSSPSAVAPAASDGPIEVVWWTYFGDTNIGYLQNIIDDYNAMQDKYVVSVEYQGSQSEMNAKIQSTTQSELPAMFSGAVENVAAYAISDYCAPLQPYIDADKEGWPELENTWNAIRAAYCDNEGNQIGYPCGYSYGGVFYNADMLKAANIDPHSIESFDDLYNACEALVQGGHTTYGVGFHPDGFYFNAALGREGLQAYNAGNGYEGQITECLYNSDPTVHAALSNMLGVYQKLHTNKLAVPYGSDYQGEIIPLIASGDCAMMIGVVSMTTKILDSVNGAFEVGIVPMISATENGKRTGEPAGGTGSYVCNNGNPEQMQGAYEFIKFMSTADPAAYFATSTGYLAPNLDAYNSEIYQSFMKDTFPAVSYLYESLEASDDSANNPYIPISNEMKSANKLAIETVSNDPNASIDDAITVAYESIQEAIDLYNMSN